MDAARAGRSDRLFAYRRRALAALVLGLLAVVGLPGAFQSVPPARALSCVPIDIHDQLRDARFAFIGRPTAEVPGPQPFPRQFLFDVEVWVKGNLGSPVMVRGFEWSTPEIGQRMAMIAGVHEDGTLRDLECVGTSPETLLAIAELETEPRSTDPPALLVGGEFGPARVMALDGQGRLAGLGPGEGAVVAMAGCPGGRRSVELVAEFAYSPPGIIAVRDLATLDIVREASLPFVESGFSWPAALSCRDENGDEVMFGLPGEGIQRWADGLEPLHDGFFTAFAIGSRWAVVAGAQGIPEEGGSASLSLLDLATGDETPLAPTPTPMQPTAFAFSPDETHLAYFGTTPYNHQPAGMFVHVIDLSSGELVASRSLPAPQFCDSCWGDVAWLDDQTLLVRDRRWDERDDIVSTVRILSLPDLEPGDELSGGQANVAQVAAGVLLTIDQAGGGHRLVAMRLDDGREVEVRALATNNASSLLALPAFDAAAAAAYTSQTPPSPAPASPGPASPGPTAGSTPVPDPSATPAFADLLAPVALLLIAGLLVGGALVWRRRLPG